MLSQRTLLGRVWRPIFPALLVSAAGLPDARAQFPDPDAEPPLLATLQLQSGSGTIGFAPAPLSPAFESDIDKLVYNISIPFEHDEVEIVSAQPVDSLNHIVEEPTIPQLLVGQTTPFEIRVSDFFGLGEVTTYTINVTRGASNNVAVLSNLVVSDTLLTPIFGQLTFGYTGSVSSDLAAVAVTPTAQSATATITVDGTLITSEAPSKSVTLTGEVTPVIILVTDEDVTKAYTIDISKRPPVPDVDMDDLPDDYELANGLDHSVNDALGDLDGDGLNNLGEYAFGSDPNDASSHHFPVVTRNGAGFLVVTFRRAIDPTLGAYQVQVSSDLSTWTGDVFDLTNSGTPEIQVWRDNNGGSPSAPPIRFARVLFHSSL